MMHFLVKAMLAGALLVGTSTAQAQLICDDLRYGSDGYHDNMDRLAKEARLPGGRWSRYHETAVSDLCKGEAKNVEQLIDSGLLRRSEFEAIKESLGMDGRSEEGRRRGYLTERFVDMHLCSACASSITEYYIKKPGSQCAKLAKRAIEGDARAIRDLQANPSFCIWNY